MHTFRVRFHAPLSDARLTSPDAPLPPLKRQAAKTPEPMPVAQTVDPWDTDVGKQVRAEEQLIRGALAALRTAAADAAGRPAPTLAQMQQVAVEIALTIAARLLHQHVDGDQFPVEAMVRDMAGQMFDDAPVAVRLNPADLELLEKRLNGEPLFPGQDDPRLIPDGSIGRGSCRIEGGAGTLLLSDPSRELQEIRDDLLRRLTNANAGS